MRHSPRLRFNSWTVNAEESLWMCKYFYYSCTDGNIELSPWRAQRTIGPQATSVDNHTLIACNCVCGWSGSGCIFPSVLIALWHKGTLKCVWEWVYMQIIIRLYCELKASNMIWHFIIKLTFKHRSSHMCPGVRDNKAFKTQGSNHQRQFLTF